MDAVILTVISTAIGTGLGALLSWLITRSYYQFATHDSEGMQRSINALARAAENQGWGVTVNDNGDVVGLYRAKATLVTAAATLSATATATPPPPEYDHQHETLPPGTEDA